MRAGVDLPQAREVCPTTTRRLIGEGALPATAQARLRCIEPLQRWLPGRRLFAALLVGAGGCWVSQAWVA